MNETFDALILEEQVTEFTPTYNIHYIEVDAQNRITNGWSDAFKPDTEDAICINEHGSYQFRLFPDGEENPNLYTWDMVPLYKWDGEKVVARTEAEIEADRAARKVLSLPDVQSAKLAKLSAACSKTIVAGCDVELSGVSGHISLTAEDQINLTAALNAVEQGAEGYPYHLDGQLCAVFSAGDIRLLAQAAAKHKLYNTTYYNHLAEWVRRCETVEEVQEITYGAELPEDLAANMQMILEGAESENNV